MLRIRVALLLLLGVGGCVGDFWEDATKAFELGHFLGDEGAPVTPNLRLGHLLQLPPPQQREYTFAAAAELRDKVQRITSAASTAAPSASVTAAAAPTAAALLREMPILGFACSIAGLHQHCSCEEMMREVMNYHNEEVTQDGLCGWIIPMSGRALRKFGGDKKLADICPQSCQRFVTGELTFLEGEEIPQEKMLPSLKRTVLTGVFMSATTECPAGTELAPAQSASNLNTRYGGNLNEGAAPFKPAERSVAGCVCARSWTFKPLNGAKEFVVGCHRSEGERAWCPVAGNGELCSYGLPPAAITSSESGPASEMFEKIGPKGSQDEKAHHCRGMEGEAALCVRTARCDQHAAAPTVAHDIAVAQCAHIGARLPTLQELALHVTPAATCGEAVWTIDACFENAQTLVDADAGRGYYRVFLDSSGVVRKRECSQPGGETAKRICVARPNALVRSGASKDARETWSAVARADSLWSKNAAILGVGYCGSAVASGLEICVNTISPKCRSHMRWRDAQTLCNNVGARLLTLNEMLHRVIRLPVPGTEGTFFMPCNLYSKYIWTSTPCFLPGAKENDAAAGVFVAKMREIIKADDPNAYTPICVDPNSEAQLDKIRPRHFCAADPESYIRDRTLIPEESNEEKDVRKIRNLPRTKSEDIKVPSSWDFCPDEVVTAVEQSTWASCRCKEEWTLDGVQYRGCALVPLPLELLTHNTEMQQRIPGTETLHICETETTAKICFEPKPPGTVIGITHRFGRGSGKEYGYDICTVEDNLSAPIQLFACLKREVVTADDDLVIVEVFLSQSLQCPPPFEAAQGHSDGASANINARTGGIQLLLCIRRAKRGTPGLRPIDDILVSGGNSSVLSCPCGYTAANHSKIGGHGEQHDESELPINFMELSRPFTEHKGLPWYTFLCVHRILDEVAEAKVREERAEEVRWAEDAALARAREPVDTPQNVIAFLFLVYHGIGNEALWQRFFESAPPELRDSWVIFVHHKKSAPTVGEEANGEGDGVELFNLGEWGTTMRAEGRLHIVAKHDLVATDYCTPSLVEAELQLIRTALALDTSKRIGKFVLLSGDSIPIRPYSFVHHAMLSPSGAPTRLCADPDSEVSSWERKELKKVLSVIEPWGTDTSKAFIENMQNSNYAPRKASQWKSYDRGDAEWLVQDGAPIIAALIAKKLKLSDFGCPDEYIIATALTFGRLDLNRLQTRHSCVACCPMAFWWGEGHSGRPWFVEGAPRVSGGGVSATDVCEAETMLEFRHLHRGGTYAGVWWQTRESPLTFHSLPRGLIDRIRANGQLFLRKVSEDIIVSRRDVKFMYE